MKSKYFTSALAVAVLGLGTSCLRAADAPAPSPETAPMTMPGMPHPMMMHGLMGQHLRLEKATFLGVAISPANPALQAQLGLPRESGLVVDEVLPESPAAKAGVKQYDILQKLNDQILFNGAQLSSLVHSFKAGAEVSLTLLREGKPTTVTVALGEHEEPVHPMGPMNRMFGPTGPMPGAMPLMQPYGAHPMDGRRMPAAGGAGDKDGDCDAGCCPAAGGAGPQAMPDHLQMHIKPGHTSEAHTMQNMMTADGDGSLNLSVKDGDRHLVVKDKEGKVTFDGPVNTPEQRQALPPEVAAKLEKLGHNAAH